MAFHQIQVMDYLSNMIFDLAVASLYPLLTLWSYYRVALSHQGDMQFKTHLQCLCGP